MFRPLPFIALLSTFVAFDAAQGQQSLAAGTGESRMSIALPQSISGWGQSGPAKTVRPAEIFGYMDGAGELYLGYRFKSLDVFEYTRPGSEGILVELYWMESSDDAWGLLSGDWGGESLQLRPATDLEKPDEVQALYGAGLLRLWSGNLYARVLTYQETGASKRAVLALGRAILAGRPVSKPPRLAEVIPRAIGAQFFLRTDRIVFLRSHLVLNSVYFLSQQNLLDLGLDCELAAATYNQKTASPSSKPVRMLLVRYPDEGAARKALNHFQRVYLSDTSDSPEIHGTTAIEDGWLGFVLSGRGLALIFEAPEQATTRLFIENAKQALDSVEVPND